ncbi:YkvA family protein [Sneathiella marina]|uniref:YkvA family protein n=1 Tax=Sneathiella marina TaxID=2950108 RepID=A0ABY4W0R9_9PROT|nr:YkvA family protein [Sneathiella marina]USG60807.1 YkvA family protein [Sneathiella marina]
MTKPSDDDISAFDAEKLQKDKLLVMREFGQKLRRNVGKIPFADDVTASFYCAVDGKSPAFVKAILFGALAYFIMPADVIPDFIAGLGFTDDASVLIAAMTTVSRHITDEHRKKADAFLEKETADSES